MKSAFGVLLLLLSGFWSSPSLWGRSGAQEIQLGSNLPAASARRQRVEVQTAEVRVKAGMPQWVEVQFAVDPGFHINSHTPHDELLVPTAMTIPEGSSLRVVAQRYPAGVPLRLEIGSGETLSTYQGVFRVELQMVVPRGKSALEGVLHYQACDAHACFPPRSLPVQVAVLGE